MQTVGKRHLGSQGPSNQSQNSTLFFYEFCTLVELLSDTVLFLNLHFLKEIYAIFGKIYTNLHNVGAGGQKHCKSPGCGSCLRV